MEQTRTGKSFWWISAPTGTLVEWNVGPQSQGGVSLPTWSPRLVPVHSPEATAHDENAPGAMATHVYTPHAPPVKLPSDNHPSTTVVTRQRVGLLSFMNGQIVTLAAVSPALKRPFSSLCATTKTFTAPPHESTRRVDFHKRPLSKCKCAKANTQS